MELAIIALSFVVMYLTFVTSLYFTTDKFRTDGKRSKRKGN